jgi:hypothetical protein
LALQLLAPCTLCDLALPILDKPLPLRVQCSILAVQEHPLFVFTDSLKDQFIDQRGDKIPDAGKFGGIDGRVAMGEFVAGLAQALKVFKAFAVLASVVEMVNVVDAMNAAPFADPSRSFMDCLF